MVVEKLSSKDIVAARGGHEPGGPLNGNIVPGDMRLADFYNLTNFDIEDPVMSTIGGVAFRLFDRLPAVGDEVVHEGYRFIAQEVKGLRISKIQVRKITSGEVPQDEEEQELESAAAERADPEETPHDAQHDAENALTDEPPAGSENGAGDEAAADTRRTDETSGGGS